MDVELSRKRGLKAPCQEMILASHPLMLLQHYGLPVIVALNRFGSDTEREFEMIRKHLGEQGVEALVCEHFAKGSKGATNLAKSMVKLIDEKPGWSATTPTSSGRRSARSRRRSYWERRAFDGSRQPPAIRAAK
jgi:hypothetical protein